MSPEPVPTPLEVEARIAEVAALNRLCESLAQAGRSLDPAETPPPARTAGTRPP